MGSVLELALRTISGEDAVGEGGKGGSGSAEEGRHMKIGALRGIREKRGKSLETMPYLTASGDLIIPLNAPPRYRWWQGGQTADETLVELQADNA